MWSLISMLVVFSAQVPQPSDYHIALWCLSSDCKYNQLDELYPIHQKTHSDLNLGWYYVYYTPTLEYIRVSRALSKIAADLEVAADDDSVGNQIEMIKNRLSYYHNYPNPAKYNFYIPTYLMIQNRNFVNNYRDIIDKRIKSGLEIDRMEKLGAALQEANRLYMFWDSMVDASNKNLSFGQRKNALIRVYDFLGKDDFYQGNYPPAAPFWRFQDEN